jgi:hypothetical protein
MEKEIEKKEDAALAVLDVKRFNPLKARIKELVEKVGNTVSSTTADCPYALLKENKKILADERIAFVKMLKEERSSALAYQNSILDVEKSLLAIVEPLESKLKEKIKAIDDEEERKSRLVTLPERKEKLAAIGVVAEDNDILMMDGIKFSAFFNEKKEAYLAEQERLLREAQEKIEREKQEAEDKRLREEEIERARAEAVESERVRQEEDKIKEEAERKAAAEREKEEFERKLREQKEQMEKERRDEEQRRIEIIKEEERRKIEEERKKAEEEERLQKEKEEESLKMVRNEKFKKFLEDCGYNDKEFKIERNGNTVICYKKVGEITL